MKKQEQVSRKWYIVDAADKPIGRVATQISTILRHRAERRQGCSDRG